MNLIKIDKLPEKFEADNLLEVSQTIGDIFEGIKKDKTHKREFIYKLWLLGLQEARGNHKLEKDLMNLFLAHEIRKYMLYDKKVSINIFAMKLLSMYPSITNENPVIIKNQHIEQYIRLFENSIGGMEINLINTIKLAKAYDISCETLVKNIIVLSFWWERMDEEIFKLISKSGDFTNKLLDVDLKSFKDISDELTIAGIRYSAQDNW